MFKMGMIALLCLGSAAANADIVVGDWKEQGDELIRLDTTTGDEWLAFSQTATVNAIGAKAEFSTGGLFEGFKIANSDNVESLVKSFSGENDLEELFYPDSSEPLRYTESLSSNRYIVTGGYSKTRDSVAFELVQLYIEMLGANTPSTANYYYSGTQRLIYENVNREIDPAVRKQGDYLSISAYAKLETDTADNDDEAFFDLHGHSGWDNRNGIALIVDDYETYSSLNDDAYATVKLEGKEAYARAVSTPFFPVAAILGLFGLGASLSRKRKAKTL